jgi:hypothetical protein
MSVTCPKCKYVRTATDQAPGWQCPSCGVAYLKVRVPESNATARPAPALSPAPDQSESEAGARRILPFALGGVLLVAIAVTAVYRPFRTVPSALTAAANIQGADDTSIASPVDAQASADAVRLVCGERTYRLSKDKIDDDIRAACEQAKQLLAAVQAYQAATVHYTCQDSEGHIREGRTVPKYLLDDYTRNCQEYVVAAEAVRSGTQDRSLGHGAALAAYRAAAKKFTDKSNEIALRGAADADVLFQQKTTNEGHLNKLIKRAGGSVEIPE